jgi:hypothetical protein
MTPLISAEQALGLRLRAQGLAGARATGVAQAVRRAAGLQAQNTAACRLSVWTRSEGLHLDDVTRACNTDRTVVRSWLMRGTLHMVPAEDLRWLTALLGPATISRDRRRRHELGLDDGTCARALPAIRASLGTRGPLTRAELVGELRARGVEVDPSGQAPAHLMLYASASGLTCRGPDREDGEPCYVLVDEWVGDQVGARPAAAGDPEAGSALAELARRYLTAFGPATVADLASWAGIALGRARAAVGEVAGEFGEVALAGEPAWLAGPVPAEAEAEGEGDAEAEPAVRLLPAFDTYLLGYRSRDLALDPAFARRINAGGGIIHPSVLVGGRVAGTWRLRPAGGRAVVAVEPFSALDGDLRAALEREVADLGRFLDADAVLQVGG